MSRTPVRAAFVQLEAEGLLRLYPKRGALVVPVSAREAESVMETRWVIERYAIERPTPELGAQLAAAADAPRGLEGSEFVEADRAFHRAAGRGHGQRHPALALRLAARSPAPDGAREHARRPSARR